MRDYGYSGSARSLEEESGVQMESEDVVRFRAALQHGDWGVAIDLIPAVAFSLPVQQRIRLAILQRKYEELLSRGCISEALLCLRTDFADSSSENAALLESMSSLMIEGVWRATDNGQQDRADLLLHIEAIVKEEHVPPFSDVVACSHIAQKGTSASFISRDHLEDSWGSESHALQSQSHGAAPVLSGARGEGLSGSASAGSHPVVSLLPRARLPQLLAQALALQLSVCQYHNVHHSPSSLFYDHCCSSETIPHISKEVFSPEPSTKFLHLAYSPDGRCLAASTETGQVYVWSVEKGHLGEQYSLDLRKTSDPVCFLCWSPDSSLMLSCTGCGSVFLSDMKAKVLLWKALFFSQKVNCCAWFPDGNSFVCAANDSRAYLVSLEKDPLLLWSNLKAHDIAVDLDGKMLYAIHGSAVHARSLDIERRRCDQVWCVRVGRTIESMSLSLDGALMLLSLTGPDEIYVLDVANKQVNQRFKGHRNGSTPSRNCFGGARDTFVAAGNDGMCCLVVGGCAPDVFDSSCLCHCLRLIDIDWMVFLSSSSSSSSCLSNVYRWKHPDLASTEWYYAEHTDGAPTIGDVCRMESYQPGPDGLVLTGRHTPAVGQQHDDNARLRSHRAAARRCEGRTNECSFFRHLQQAAQVELAVGPPEESSGAAPGSRLHRLANSAAQLIVVVGY